MFDMIDSKTYCSANGHQHDEPRQSHTSHSKSPSLRGTLGGIYASPATPHFPLDTSPVEEIYHIFSFPPFRSIFCSHPSALPCCINLSFFPCLLCCSSPV